MADERLGHFIKWMQDNGIQLHGCTIRHSSERGGYGVFAGDQGARDVLMVSPLALSLTSMTILKDPLLGGKYREMLENDVDERLLVMIFLIIERARGKSSFWSPYLEMLPSDFGTPLWYNDDELAELDGTMLYDATKAQLRSLKKLFDNVKKFSEAALSSIDFKNCGIVFEDFLWANCIFWTRALNIPCPASFKADEHQELGDPIDGVVWTEGLVPGIDFCNHAHGSGALWEVDGKAGSTSGVPHSMYLLAVPDVSFAPETEICINYGDKGNEELLFLYGFVEDNNSYDYIMVHFPMEILEQNPCLEHKLQLIQEQDMPLQWLLPSSYLEGGFLDASGKRKSVTNERSSRGYSWSGLRKPPSYLSSLVFPDDMLSTLRVLAMSEVAFQNVASLLEELTHMPSKEDILAAIWEVCGDTQALSLLVDIFSTRMTKLVRGTGSEDQDEELLITGNFSSGKHRASVVYRKGQKHLVGRFLKEAEMALAACLQEDEE